MTDQRERTQPDGRPPGRFPDVGDGTGIERDGMFFAEEVQLALRNHGMPLEALRYDITPTGMHYVLVHFDVPETDAASWRLEIGGLVSRPVSLSLGELQARPALTMPVTMECAGNGRALLTPRPVSQPWGVDAIGTAEWTGTPLRPLLEEAGVRDDACELLFTGADEGVQGDEVQFYQRSLTLPEAMRDEVLLAYAMNARPLEPQHGYPLRLLVPGWFGMTSVKWLRSIEAISEPFCGYQMIGSYRYSTSEEDPGEPVDLQRVRALMVPPGIPDFATRRRLVQAGAVTLRGRAWAGRRAVAKVEVSDDGGRSWREARLEPPVGSYAWCAWSCKWTARPGEHTLLVRATDAAGEAQPVEQPWTMQGMGNNMCQRMPVLVE